MALSVVAVTLRWFFIFHLIHHHVVDAFSACDEIDITMVIDVASILSDSEGLLQFITDIIGSGSSERSAFSAVVYGDQLPVTQRIKMVTLLSTQPEMVRKNAKKQVCNRFAEKYSIQIAVLLLGHR